MDEVKNYINGIQSENLQDTNIRHLILKIQELGKELTSVEELAAYENEIKKLKIDPQKLRRQEEDGEYRNKLVRETELERYLNKGWEMVQTVNSRILIRKPVSAGKRS